MSPPRVRTNPDGSAVLLDDDESAVLITESLPTVPTVRAAPPIVLSVPDGSKAVACDAAVKPIVC